jgi:glycine cleavage system H protein
VDGDEATLGITWYAQDQLGEVVFFEPPEIGKTMTKDDAYAEVESVKAVSDVIAPLSGEIVAVNEDLGENPEKINDDPYGGGWMVRIRLTQPAEKDDLMAADAYSSSLQ